MAVVAMLTAWPAHAGGAEPPAGMSAAPRTEPESVLGEFLQSDSLMQQESKLSGRPLSGFGWSVALSADENTALIGGPSDNGGVGARGLGELRRRRSHQFRQRRRPLRGRPHGGGWRS